MTIADLKQQSVALTQVEKAGANLLTALRKYVVQHFPGQKVRAEQSVPCELTMQFYDIIISYHIEVEISENEGRFATVQKIIASGKHSNADGELFTIAYDLDPKGNVSTDGGTWSTETFPQMTFDQVFTALAKSKKLKVRL